MGKSMIAVLRRLLVGIFFGLDFGIGSKDCHYKTFEISGHF
jgi:hypothetical protein